MVKAHSHRSGTQPGQSQRGSPVTSHTTDDISLSLAIQMQFWHPLNAGLCFSFGCLADFRLSFKLVRVDLCYVGALLHYYGPQPRKISQSVCFSSKLLITFRARQQVQKLPTESATGWAKIRYVGMDQRWRKQEKGCWKSWQLEVPHMSNRSMLWIRLTVAHIHFPSFFFMCFWLL